MGILMSIEHELEKLTKDIDGERRGIFLSGKLEEIKSYENIDTGELDSSLVEGEILSGAELNLWELCYFLRTYTDFCISKDTYETALAKAIDTDNIAFKITLMDLAISSGIVVFPEAAPIQGRQHEELEKISMAIYGLNLANFNSDTRKENFSAM